MAKYVFPDIPLNLISGAPHIELKLSVCIPCHNETDVRSTIQSIDQCTPISGVVEVIVLINDSEKDSESVRIQNQYSYEECIELNNVIDNNKIDIIPIYVTQISLKKAGVGYARRLAMDEANRRFTTIGRDRGIIACLDADTIVSDNYVTEIIKFFDDHTNLSGCSIAFEHNLNNIPDPKIKSAICDYESHLRYFINMQRLIGLTFAYQTVGSAMAVTSKSYVKQGRMNTRKAGEDFYFMHKFIKNGLVGELNTSCVYPSARVSDRVPFGTGKAVGDILQSDENYQTYNSQSFWDIDSLIKRLASIYSNNEFQLSTLSDGLRSYLEKENFTEKIIEIKSNTTTYESFEKRFFQWFDAFRLMKCLHFLRDTAYPNVKIDDAMLALCDKLGLEYTDDKYDNLRGLRAYDLNYVM